jgi:hypothetical protein
MRATNALLLLVLGACDRPKVGVICHNANCVEPTDPEADDTLPAMRESLALQIDGRPAIDAVEIDSFWRGSDDTCLFAHDLESGTMTPMSEAATELANHITTAPVLTRNGGVFRVFLELKQHTDKAEVVPHTPAQRLAHVDCAWSVYDAIATAAMTSGHEVEFVFASFGPDLLRDVVSTAAARTLPIPYKLDTFFGIPKPLDSETQPLDHFKGIPLDIVEIHPQWIHDAQFEALRSLDVEIVFWTFSATVETFAAIEQYEPDMVGTSEARLMVRWLEN